MMSSFDMGTKRAPRRARKAPARRSSGVQATPAPTVRVVLTALGRWETQLQRLTDWRARVEAAPSMQGDSWKRGQLRHIDALIAEHRAAKPQGV